VLYLWLIILSVGDDVLVDNETFLMIDFMNLKIKLTQFFRGAHRGRVYVHVFIWVSDHTYVSMYFSKKAILPNTKKFRGMIKVLSHTQRNGNGFLMHLTTWNDSLGAEFLHGQL
jgi:hypothetical protein